VPAGMKSGVWIKWFPESEQQDKDVSMRVVQHMFDLQAKPVRLRRLLPAHCCRTRGKGSRAPRYADVRLPAMRRSVPWAFIALLPAALAVALASTPDNPPGAPVP
jgi:hypothetical protein